MYNVIRAIDLLIGAHGLLSKAHPDLGWAPHEVAAWFAKVKAYATAN